MHTVKFFNNAFSNTVIVNKNEGSQESLEEILSTKQLIHFKHRDYQFRYKTDQVYRYRKNPVTAFVVYICITMWV